MPPTTTQRLVDEAWPTIEQATAKALGDPATWPISKVCPPTTLHEHTWKTEGCGQWKTATDRRAAAGRPESFRTRQLEAGERQYLDLAWGLVFSPDELAALTIVGEHDDLYMKLGQWAAGARALVMELNAAALVGHAGSFTLPTGASVEDVLGALAPIFGHLGRFRLVRPTGTIAHAPRYVKEQIELGLYNRSLDWRALLVPIDRAAITVARAFPPRLGWEPCDGGVTLLLRERFCHRAPPQEDLQLLTVIR